MSQMNEKLDNQILSFNVLKMNADNFQGSTTSPKTVQGLMLTVLSFALFFYFMRLIVDCTFNRKYLTNSKSVRPEKVWEIKNLQISFIHSTLSSVLMTYTLIKKSQMFDDLLLYVCYESYMAISFSLGYFVYDLFDMYYNNKIVSLWQVTIHHAVCIFICGYNLINLYSLGYMCIGMTMEVNSVFLHARKILKLYGFGDSPTTNLIKFFNFFTFFVFRFGTLAFAAYSLYTYSYRLSFFNRILNYVAFSLMLLINIALFQVLLTSDLFLKRKKADKTK
jgi:hypothetical protein